MSAHIPEFRRAAAGRTHAQTWQPEAVEITRRHWLREVPTYAGLVAFLALVLFGLPALAHFVARAAA